MTSALQFFWAATRGYRFRPWRSPYLRWRLETYSGQKAETIEARDFFRFMWRERGQLGRFMRWTREMQEYPPSVD